MWVLDPMLGHSTDGIGSPFQNFSSLRMTSTVIYVVIWRGCVTITTESDPLRPVTESHSSNLVITLETDKVGI